jgi:adenylate cyclase
MLLFDTQAIMLDLFYPLATIALTYTTVTTYRLSTEARLRREVMRLFANNVAPNVAKAALQAVRSGDLNLGGQVKELALLVVDIRGHAKVAHAYEPSQVMALMNRFRALVANTVMSFDGTLAHTESEQIMVIFNAPLAQPDYVLRAVETAVALRAHIHQYQHTLPPDDPEKEIGFACGIYAGRAIVGSFGASQRAIYTAFGDTVSIATQLAAHAQANQILIGDTAFQQVKGRVTAVDLRPILLRERSLPVAIYAIEGAAPTPS